MAFSLDRQDVRVAIICAMPIESQAVEKLFDAIYETKTLLWQKAEGDRNAYMTGRIGRHNAVLTYMPGIGKVNATTTASGINATFPNIELALVVGVCGGSTYIPNSALADKSENEPIYLGDVVISTEIQQYDFGREMVDGYVVKGPQEGNSPLPSAGISALLHKLQGSELPMYIKDRAAAYTRHLLHVLQISAPGQDEDILYQADYFHKHRSGQHCDVCRFSETSMCETSQKASCRELQCERTFQQRSRERDPSSGPRIFLGRVSSTDTVKRNGLTRNYATAIHNILAFEMEGAGVCAVLPTLVIKGVCDYADSHKHKLWQGYAAVTAAACCKALLEEWFSSSISPESAPLYEEKKISDENRTKCLASLDFPQLDHRLTNISFPHFHTCEWISTTFEFKKWLDKAQLTTHYRVLWIKGKPGSGKSTMMKHLYHTSSQYLPKHTVLSYFFHARGSELERSPIGMLRSLLFQLLSHRSDLLDKLIRQYPKRASTNLDPYQWTVEELQNFFLLCAREGHLNDIVILVDALDECDADEAGKIAGFYEDLSINSVARNASFFICMSIRHFPNIDIKTCIKLNLDERSEHKEDIKSYVEAKLRVEDGQHLVDQIIQRSNHVFLWAVLVVENLNAAHDEGVDDETLQDMLSNTPNELHAIFDKLLGPQQLTFSETRLVLQIVLYAFEPLSISELYFLIHAGVRANTVRARSFAKKSPNLLHKYFISKSRGLLEVVRKPGSALDGSEKVQFIHESVRSFFLSSCGRTLPHADLSHEAIARACLQGMSVIYQEAEIPGALETVHLQTHVEGVYMRWWVLLHIGKISDMGKIVEMLRTYSTVFRLNFDGKWLIEDPKNDGLLCAIIRCYTVIANDREDTGHLARVLRIILADSIAMSMNISEPGKPKYTFALREAIVASWLQGVEALIQAGANLTARDTEGKTVFQWSLRSYIDSGENIQCERIVDCVLRELQETGYDFNDSTGQSPLPLVYACKRGSSRLVTKLLEAGASSTAIDPNLGAPLDAAVVADRPGIAKILLEYGADPIIRYRLDCSPTEYAAREGRLTMSMVLSAYRPRRKM